MRMGMWLRSFTSLVSQQSDFDLRTGDQTAIGRGMLGRDKFLWNIFKLVDGHKNLIKCWNVYARTAVTGSDLIGNFGDTLKRPLPLHTTGR
jgi:hypothetical protein